MKQNLPIIPLLLQLIDFLNDRTTQTLEGTNFIYYYVAEPDDEYNSILTNCNDEATETNCIDSVEIVNQKNFTEFPHYRYVFQKTAEGRYESYKKEKLESSKNDSEK